MPPLFSIYALLSNTPKLKHSNNKTQMALPILLFILTFLQHSHSSPATINVVDLGANPDGETDSTSAISKAWSKACVSSEPSTIFIPEGRFLVKSLHFKGQCISRNVTFLMNGTLVAPADYKGIGNAAYWLLFDSVDGVSIVGGTIDAQGKPLWLCKKASQNCPGGATSLGIIYSKNVQIDGLRSVHSQMFHILIIGCNNVKLQQVRIRAPKNSPNTDGIHVQLSTGITIVHSRMGTGDDCISIGPGTTNVWIENVICGPGHGISIGSLGWDFDEPGVRNVTVKSVTFTNTMNGVRIKTWGRPSKGFVKQIHFEHVTMKNAYNPIIIDQSYCPNLKNCPKEVSGVKISDVSYKNIQGTSASQIAVKFNCSEAEPCQNIWLEDVNLSYRNQEARSWCSNAAGSTAGEIEPSSCLI